MLESHDASMRPRVFPAEDLVVRPASMSCATRFNEAAGIPRGRQALQPSGVRPAQELQ